MKINSILKEQIELLENKGYTECQAKKIVRERLQLISELMEPVFSISTETSKKRRLEELDHIIYSANSNNKNKQANG